jgi:hypothetical protein
MMFVRPPGLSPAVPADSRDADGPADGDRVLPKKAGVTVVGLNGPLPTGGWPLCGRPLGGGIAFKRFVGTSGSTDAFVEACPVLAEIDGVDCGVAPEVTTPEPADPD